MGKRRKTTGDRSGYRLGRQRARAYRARREAERCAVELPSNVRVIQPDKPLVVACGLDNGPDHTHDRACLTMDGRTLDQLAQLDQAERERDGRPAFGASVPWTTPTVQEITP